MASSDTPDVVGDLAGVLAEHAIQWGHDAFHCTCGYQAKSAYGGEAADLRHQARVLRQFIRAQSPEWVAELIGDGEVQWGVTHAQGTRTEHNEKTAREWREQAAARYADSFRNRDVRVAVVARVVGPWREVDDRG